MSTTQLLASYDEVADWAAAAARPVFVAVGFFDGVHRGHQHLLTQHRKAANAADAATLVITFANSPKNFHRLERQTTGETFPQWYYLTTAAEKVLLLSGLGLDAVLLLDYEAATAQQSARDWLMLLSRELAADQGETLLAGLTVGYDTSIGSDLLSGREAFTALTAELGLQLNFVEPYTPDGVAVKSSLIREALAAGELESAARLLGHPYFCIEEVASGKGLGGSELGIPTANLPLPPEKLLPPAGVYAGIAELESMAFPAAISLASVEQSHNTVLDREAVKAGRACHYPEGQSGAQMLAEAHLIGFHGDLYGQALKLSLLKRLRGWSDFDSPQGLREQIQRDIRDSIGVVRDYALSLEEQL